MRRAIEAPVSLLLVLALAAPAAAGVGTPAPMPFAHTGFGVAPGAEPPVTDPGPVMGSALAIPSALIDDAGLLAARGMGERKDGKKKTPKPDEPAEPEEPASERAPRRLQQVFSGRRARLMLQSLTVPGWGQASLGEKRTGLAFALAEVGIWGAFTAFKIQQTMRQRTYVRTAALFAGIDLSGRDEEFRRVVSFYISSEEYNQLVVRRDATNLYYGDPAAYSAYVAAHELKGSDTWAWNSEGSLLQYREERQNAQRAIKHAHDALAAAVINRLLSMIHASAGEARKDPAARSLKLECVPASDDPTTFHLGLRADF